MQSGHASVERVRIGSRDEVADDRAARRGVVAHERHQPRILWVLFIPPDRQRLQLPKELPVPVLKPYEAFPAIPPLDQGIGARVVGVTSQGRQTLCYADGVLFLGFAESLKPFRDEGVRGAVRLIFQLLANGAQLNVDLLKLVRDSCGLGP